MKTMAYKEAYLTLMVDMRSYYSPVKDIAKYIDKMAMIGKKYRCLEKDIRASLQGQRTWEALKEVESACSTELDVLDLMTETTIHGLETNEKFNNAMKTGDEDLAALIKDFQIVRLAVKARTMSAKAEMHELLSQLDRHRSGLLVK